MFLGHYKDGIIFLSVFTSVQTVVTAKTKTMSPLAYLSMVLVRFRDWKLHVLRNV